MKAYRHVLVTDDMIFMLKRLTKELNTKEKNKKCQSRRRITRAVVCQELVKRCYEKGVIK